MNTALWWMLQNAVTTACLVPLVLLACRLFRDRPAVQHALWLMVLVKLITPPLAVWPWEISNPFTTTRYAEPRVEMSALPINLPPSPHEMEWSVTTLLGGLALAVWVAGAVVLAVRQSSRLYYQARRVRQGILAPRELRDTVRAVAGTWGMAGVPVFLVRGILSPFLWCLGRARLIWPDQPLPQDACRAIIAHELAHLRRRDHWVAWLELAAMLIWWWNPLFWLVRRNLRLTSEMACDALALAAFPNQRIEYAETLLGLSASSRTGVPALALGVGTGTPSSLERRLSMIVSARATGKLSRPGILMVGLLTALILPGWALGQSDDDEGVAKKKAALARKKLEADHEKLHAHLHHLAMQLHKLAEAAHEGDDEAAEKIKAIKELLAAKSKKAKVLDEKQLVEKQALVELKLAEAARHALEHAEKFDTVKRRIREQEVQGQELKDKVRRYQEVQGQELKEKVRRFQEVEGQQLKEKIRRFEEVQGKELPRKHREEAAAHQELQAKQKKQVEAERQALEADLHKLATMKKKLAQAEEASEEELTAELKALQRKLAEVKNRKGQAK